MSARIEWHRHVRGRAHALAFTPAMLCADNCSLPFRAMCGLLVHAGEFTPGDGERCGQCSRAVARRAGNTTSAVIPAAQPMPRLPSVDVVREMLLEALGAVDDQTLRLVDDVIASARQEARREAAAAARAVMREHRDAPRSSYVETVMHDAAIAAAVKVEGAIARAARGPRTGVVSPRVSAAVVSLERARARRMGGAA